MCELYIAGLVALKYNSLNINLVWMNHSEDKFKPEAKRVCQSTLPAENHIWYFNGKTWRFLM